MDSFMYIKLLYVFCNIVTSDKFNASLLNKSLISNKKVYLSPNISTVVYFSTLVVPQRMMGEGEFDQIQTS